MGLVYKITNKLNGRAYVGKTVRSLSLRWKYHLAEARAGRNDMLICKAIRKYGPENFIVEMLEECENSVLNEREIAWIAKLNTYEDGYNLTLGGEGTAGYRFSEESRKKMSESATRSRTGKKRGPYKKWSQEARETRRLQRLGKKHSEETKKKIGESRKRAHERDKVSV